MTGYSNYDIFMNYCEGYLDAYNDFGEDYGYDNFDSSNPFPFGSKEYYGQSYINSKYPDRTGMDDEVLDGIAKAGARVGKNTADMHAKAAHLQSIKTLASNIGASVGEVTRAIVQYVGENPVQVGAIAAGALAAGVGSIVGLRAWLKRRKASRK